MSKTQTQPDSQFHRPQSAADWVKRKEHDVVLPSGVEVTIALPNLPQMIRSGEVPNDLVDAAIGAMQSEKVTKELLTEQAEFYQKLVAMTLVSPKLTEDDVPSLPYEDIELLVELATRQRDVDAVGRHLAGLHTSKEWRKFRGFDHLDPDLEG